METSIKDRLFALLDEFEKINKSNVLRPSQNNRRKKQDKQKKTNPLENLEKESQTTNSIEFSLQNSYPSSFENIILTDNLPFQLPIEPVPYNVLKIINLGTSCVKVSANENETIFHAFYAPKGSPHIFLTINSVLEVFFIEKDTGEKVWLAK
jgi:hypothetical protein